MFHVKQWRRWRHIWRCWRSGRRGSTSLPNRPWTTLGVGISPNSAQLWALRAPGARRWLDLGSGAGFPGLVVAAIAAEAAPDLTVDLVESDQRKAAFLRAVIQATGLRAMVHDCRVESLAPQGADVVSARALAPLAGLLPMLEKHRRPGGIGLFPKGGTVHKELTDAAMDWRFDYKIHPSLTEQKAAIVEIGAMSRA